MSVSAGFQRINVVRVNETYQRRTSWWSIIYRCGYFIRLRDWLSLMLFWQFLTPPPFRRHLGATRIVRCRITVTVTV